MRLRSQRDRRDGTILPLVAVSLISLLGFVALAIDLGVMALARNQCQNAADAAATAGARALNGDTTTNNNSAGAVTTAKTAAKANSVLAQPVQDSQVTPTVGKYYFSQSANQFIAWPVSPGSTDSPSDPWTLVNVSITSNNNATSFGTVLGMNSFNTGATATAVHRPRDVAIIVDFSGSMRFDSMLGAPHGGYRQQSMNPDPVIPLFGHYSASSSAALSFSTTYQVPSGEIIGPCNDTSSTTSGTALINDFYQDTTPLGTTTPAFTSAGSGDVVGRVSGDKYLMTNFNKTTTYAQTVSDILNTTTKDNAFQTNGYDDPRFATNPASPKFAGYMQGPLYWGKSFFVWPPDPRPTMDWREKFFFKSDGVTPVDDNSLLWDASGNWLVPADNTNNNYRINYNAILNWIRASGPNPFPPQLRSGGVLYYDSIPSTIDTSTFPPSDPNQRFWKEYIDEVLGVQQYGGNGTNPVYQVVTPYTGYGDDFSWGTQQISAKPSDGRYMDYKDNPMRPRVHFWFGPMSMLDFLGNYNLGRFWWPGTTHESATWQCKLGIQAALGDIQKNHPNDNVALAFFSSPKTAYNSTGFYNQVRVPLSRDYKSLLNSLWFSPRTIANPTPEIRPYDNGGLDITDIPKANGGTCYAMPLMLVYNQFSGNSSLQTYATSPAPMGQAGGNGRKGAQKLIIFETDGMVNTTASANFTNAGAYKSYYNIRLQDNTGSASNEYPTNVVGSVSQGTTQALAVVSQICALDSAGSPGYSTPNKPVLIHTLAFGTLFDPSNTSSYKTNALNLLQNIQYIGGKAGGEQATLTTPLASYKIIVGPYTQRIQDIQNAFGKIMQDGIQVSLIQ
jgi:Flp pilus assembly protein TadG